MKLANPILVVTAFSGTSMERQIETPLDMTKDNPLQVALAAALIQQKALEESCALEMHIAAIEAKQGKRLTKPQRELITLSFNLANGVEPDESSEPEAEPEPKQETKPEPKPKPEKVEPEPEEEPKTSEQVVEEETAETKAETDASVEDALAALGL